MGEHIETIKDTIASKARGQHYKGVLTGNSEMIVDLTAELNKLMQRKGWSELKAAHEKSKLTEEEKWKPGESIDTVERGMEYLYELFNELKFGGHYNPNKFYSFCDAYFGESNKKYYEGEKSKKAKKEEWKKEKAIKPVVSDNMTWSDISKCWTAGVDKSAMLVSMAVKCVRQSELSTENKKAAIEKLMEIPTGKKRTENVLRLIKQLFMAWEVLSGGHLLFQNYKKMLNEKVMEEYNDQDMESE